MKYGLIDTAALLYSSKFAMPKLYVNDQATGILYGFVRYLLALQKEFNFDQFIFCNDSLQSKRKELYPEYKSGRHINESRELIYSQFNIIKNEILPNIGFKNIFESEGLEADDVIASLCQTKKLDDEYIIISRDGDLYQLLDENISQWDYISKKMITKRSFKDKYGIEPKDWGMVKAISGCKSDTVKGIDRIGEKSAIKYINHSFKKNSKPFIKIESNKDIIERNKPLVILPFDNTPEFKIVDDELSFGALTKMFIKYNFQSQLYNKSLDEWRVRFRWTDIKNTIQLSDYW